MDMIERAVQAFLAAPTRNATFETFVHHDEAVSAVRAVIEALREPSDVVRLVGVYTQIYGETEDDRHAYGIWQAMIDAALEDVTPPNPQS